MIQGFYLKQNLLAEILKGKMSMQSTLLTGSIIYFIIGIVVCFLASSHITKKSNTEMSAAGRI